jgi:predicted O-linked N-acetylglucosamine transferase (SPINDLY family)
VSELVTQSWRDFEALAVRLARDQPFLANVRHVVQRGRTGSPLFDTALFCRNLERAYQRMIEIGKAGKTRAEIDLRA